MGPILRNKPISIQDIILPAHTAHRFSSALSESAAVQNLGSSGGELEFLGGRVAENVSSLALKGS